MIVECPQCQALVDAIPLKHHYIHDNLAPTVRVTFGHCPRCSGAVLTQAFEDLPGWEAEEQVFPPIREPLPANLPKGIRDAYSEAQTCFRSHAYTAAAVMCRKTLEGVCAEHGFRERTLAESLRKMRDAGSIEARLFDWADALRISGNEAAHGVELTVNAQDASDIIDFTQALIEYVFTFRDRFEQFKARRLNRANQSGEAEGAS